MEIRDQLGILEATLVPDADDIVPAAAAESSIGKLDSRNKGLDEECLGAPSLSSAGGSQSAGDTSSKITATSGEGTEMSRSNSTSSHGSIGKSSNPTSVVDEYDGLAGELELLTALFPAM